MTKEQLKKQIDKLSKDKKYKRPKYEVFGADDIKDKKKK